MSAVAVDRAATTDHPVMDVLAERWSPRAFCSSTPIDEQKLSSALEAARWSPSASNTQPWRFLVARRGSALHDSIQQCLMGFNQAWAGNAAVLLVAIAEIKDEEGAPISHARYDLGQAVAHLSIQAHHDGLFVHQMSGFVVEQVAELAELGDRFTPMTVIALGNLGSADDLPEPLQVRETAPRVRRPIDETLIANV